ncbi:hypothetical protein [Caldifermentibacillus hisashii]|uniref:hypothetical protein n=1 Tax=Caldifermentibacillus hisashii TaxID=996558 RepID=UPI00342E7B83
MSLSNSLADYIFDGDLSTKLENVEYSTNLRDIVTVGYMIDHSKGGENHDDSRRSKKSNA